MDALDLLNRETSGLLDSTKRRSQLDEISQGPAVDTDSCDTTNSNSKAIDCDSAKPNRSAADSRIYTEPAEQKGSNAKQTQDKSKPRQTKITDFAS